MAAAVQHVLVDVAGTLLVKPDVPPTISAALAAHGFNIAADEIAERHVLLSEVSEVPDRTDRAFYERFNADLLRMLGLVATPALVSDIYERCAALPWVPSEGAERLADAGVAVGVVSNWGDGLERLLARHFGFRFTPVVASSEAGVRKPDAGIYRRALDLIDADASHVVYLGDSLRLDVEPAAAAGMRTVLFDRCGVYPGHAGPRVRGFGAFLEWLRPLVSAA